MKDGPSLKIKMKQNPLVCQIISELGSVLRDIPMLIIFQKCVVSV